MRHSMPSTGALQCAPHLVEGLAIVHAHDGANHLGHNDHVAQVRPHWGWLLARLGRLLGRPQLLDEGHGLPLEAPVESGTTQWSICCEPCACMQVCQLPGLISYPAPLAMVCSGLQLLSASLLA